MNNLPPNQDEQQAPTGDERYGIVDKVFGDGDNSPMKMVAAFAGALLVTDIAIDSLEMVGIMEDGLTLSGLAGAEMGAELTANMDNTIENAMGTMALMTPTFTA